MSAEEQNALYRRQARYREAVEPTWEKVAGLTPNEYERRYLAAWGKVFQQHPYYLYPDDRYREEFGAPRLEEVGALSYENTARDVQQARAATLQRLTAQADAVLANTTDDTPRSILATLLREAAEFLSCYTLPDSEQSNESAMERGRRILAERPVFETLQAPRFTPVLPGWSGKPDYVVDEPERVGGILGQLEHFLKLRERFLAEEASAPLEKGKPATNTHSDSTPLDLADVWASSLKRGVDFTLPDLDRLLFKVGLLSEINCERPTAEFKGSAVVGVLAALRERGYLKRSDNADLALVMAGRYGSDVANPHSVARGTNALPKPAMITYTRALALLPLP